jgi:hypothetical protein
MRIDSSLPVTASSTRPSVVSSWFRWSVSQVKNPYFHAAVAITLLAILLIFRPKYISETTPANDKRPGIFRSKLRAMGGIPWGHSFDTPLRASKIPETVVSINETVKNNTGFNLTLTWDKNSTRCDCSFEKDKGIAWVYLVNDSIYYQVLTFIVQDVEQTTQPLDLFVTREPTSGQWAYHSVLFQNEWTEITKNKNPIRILSIKYQPYLKV